MLLVRSQLSATLSCIEVRRDTPPSAFRGPVPACHLHFCTSGSPDAAHNLKTRSGNQSPKKTCGVA